MEYIITSLSALYEFKIISYKPKSLYIELPLGTNKTNYSDRYKIFIQNKNTIGVGVTTINNQMYYCPERLFIELDRSPLDEPLFNQASKNLQEIIIPEEVLSIYKKIKGKRRKLNK